MQAISKEAVVGIVGAGAMGAGIAQVAASSGHRVKLFDVAPEAVTKGIAGLAKGLDKQISRGKIDREQADTILDRIEPATTLDALSDASLIVEAVVENLDVKRQIFSQLESLCRSDAIFASNTSSLSITSLAAKLRCPQRVVGMHFFNPPQAMKLVEVIDGLATENDMTERVIATAAQWGKTPVRTKSTPGFIVNRVARPFYAEALRLLQDSVADCKTIDAALTGSGQFRMGPFTLMDLIGLDVNYAVTESVFQAYYFDSRFKPSIIQKELVGGGFLGRKSGRGFYNYTDDNSDTVSFLGSVEPQKKLIVVGQPVGLQALSDLCEKQGVSVEKHSVDSSGLQHSWYEVNGTRFTTTDGRTATQCGKAEQFNNWVLVDLINDIEKCSSVVVARSDLADDQCVDNVAGFFQALGKKVVQVDDAPGMVVMRTVCMLINEAADAVKEDVCTAQAVDTAMQLGTNKMSTLIHP